MGFFARKHQKEKTREARVSVEELPILKNHYADTPVMADDYASCSCFGQYYNWDQAKWDVPDNEDPPPLQWSEIEFHKDPPHTSDDLPPVWWTAF